MIGSGIGRLALVLAGVTLVAGCEKGKPIKLFGKPLFAKHETATQAGESTGQSAPLNATTTIEKDVEAPDIFQKTDSGLWDGRPSLGGVWVAHPDVKAPERAIIRNEENGKFIIGALFKRERVNPGPKFQVSSDAAAELGMLAGAPSKLNVTVLKRVEVPVEPQATAPAVDTLEPAQETGTRTESDPVAKIAASAIEEATSNGQKDSATPTAPTPRPQAGAAEAGAVPAAPATKPAPAASGLKKPFIQIGIFSVKANADNTANLLRNSGVVPTIKEFNSNGKTYWRIVVGPVGTVSDRKAILKKVAGLGFGDAYSVTN